MVFDECLHFSRSLGCQTAIALFRFLLIYLFSLPKWELLAVQLLEEESLLYALYAPNAKKAQLPDYTLAKKRGAERLF